MFLKPYLETEGSTVIGRIRQAQTDVESATCFRLAGLLRGRILHHCQGLGDDHLHMEATRAP